MDVIDSSWPARRRPPPGLKAMQGPWTLDVHAVLAHIAERTAPLAGYGFTLAEHWAYLRYFGAVAGGTDLALAAAWRTLDSHQKTVLSDDFGIGLASLLAARAFGSLWIVDARAFIDATKPWVDLVPKRPGRRGPEKCPDFMAFSPDGRAHVIEAKGTQGGDSSREGQIFERGKRAPKKGGVTPAGDSGGRVQKWNVRFSDRKCLGERLVVASTIPLEGAGRVNVRVEDPPAVGPSQSVPWADVAAEGMASAASAAGLRMAAAYLRARGDDRKRWRSLALREMDEHQLLIPDLRGLVGTVRTFNLPALDEPGIGEVRAALGVDARVLFQALQSSDPGEVLHAWRMDGAGSRWEPPPADSDSTWTTTTPNGLVFSTTGLVDTAAGCRATHRFKRRQDEDRTRDH